MSGVGAAYYVAAAAYLMFGVLLLPVQVPVSRDHLSPFIRSLAGAPSAVILGGLVMLGVVGIMAVANRGVRELGPEGSA